MSQPVAWFRVVRASTVLPWSAKAVWEEIRMIDQGQGCWMSARVMGARLGLSPRTVEAIRDSLREAGLIASDGKPPKVLFYVLLPPSYRPSVQKPNDHEVTTLAQGLDQHLRAQSYTTYDQGSTSPTITLVHPKSSRSASSAREGGRGEGSTLKSFQRLADSPLITKLVGEKNHA